MTEMKGRALLSKTGREGRGESLEKKEVKKILFIFMVNHFLQLQACSDPAAVLTVQVKVFVFSFKMPPPTTDD